MSSNGLLKSPAHELEQRAKGFFKQLPNKLLIGGEWVDAVDGGTFDSYDPRTGEVLLSIAKSQPDDVDHAVAAARKAFDEGPWPRMAAKERARIIYKLADILEEHIEELALLETLDNGKTITQSFTVDIPETIEHFRYFAGACDKIEGSTIPVGAAGVTGKGFTAYTLREPVGVVGQILPWNFPALMAAWKLAPALAAGCTIVLKVSQHTPATGLRMVQLAQEAGVPPGVINLLTGKGSDIGDAMTSHPGIDKIAFTGSTSVGKHLGSNAMAHLKPVTLELGGKSPVLVTSSADVEAAARGATEALFFNAGQACECGARTMVDASVYDEFCQRTKTLVEERRVGDPLDPATQMGPLIDEKQMDKVLELIESGVKEGAKLLVGGKRLGDRGFYLQPTLFVDVEDHMRIAREEIFGPVQLIFKYETLEEGLRRANDTNYGLASAVWTSDVETMQLVSRSLQAGTVWVNTHHIMDAAVPFGGYKESGIGREHGHAVLEHYTKIKSVYVPLPKGTPWQIM